jgi:hypothetical protein
VYADTFNTTRRDEEICYLSIKRTGGIFHLISSVIEMWDRVEVY